MKYMNVQRFHGLADSRMPHASGSIPVTGISEAPDMALATILERSLGYRFYPHFHPYPDELIKRLIKGSMQGLQNADTEYMDEPLPQSTRVKMPDGRLVTLPDDISISIDGGSPVTLPSRSLMSSPEGTEVELLEDITIPSLDGSSEIYPLGTRAKLVSVKPKPSLYEELFSTERYNPSTLVTPPRPVKDLDFTPSGAYSVYNWELLYHVPLTIAIHLSKNQRFEEAMRWFHFVFDPTDDSDGPTPERFWKARPFQHTDVKLIEEVLVNLVTGTDPDLRFMTLNCINAWMNSPFRPHQVARYRQTPYMFKTVMAYLDNLIAWGDSLFRDDSRESINEAMQLYVLAANLLGERPQAVPKKGEIRPQTYANLKRDLAAFGTVLRDAEDILAHDSSPLPGTETDIERYNALRSIGHALYFCVPRNDKLLGYWDTVADRLFKIRNSLNIQGIFRQLPLFEPPIDPALLAKATAAGLDVGTIVSGVNQPLPLVRFQFLIQKAAEICQEVKSLGNNLLAAIEKEDNEAIALLRTNHEICILKNTQLVKDQNLQEVMKNCEGLQKSYDNAVERYKYYERLLDRGSWALSNIDPELLEVDALRTIRFEIAQDIEELEEAGGIKISPTELEEMTNLRSAHGNQKTGGEFDSRAAFFGTIPNFSLNTQPFGVGFSTSFGGSNVAAGLNSVSNYYKTEAMVDTYSANRAIKIASYERREQEWIFQSNQAKLEILQVHKQILASEIRKQIAEKEIENHDHQIQYAEEIEQFLRGEETTIGDNLHQKKSTQGFYAWMKREVKGLYGQVFQFAFDIAKKAERALQHELADHSQSFLRFGHLAGKEGLLAGENLYLDIKRMEMAYHDLHRREYELTKHVSLMQVDPLAMIRLRETGSCTVALPESLFDMDCPGHYFRRIKSVALSIPCVSGPYSSVNCTLTLQKSSIRIKSQLNDSNGYKREGCGDPRFDDHYGSLQSIVTSSGQNDTGMFETNLHDERYLPFENSGVISEWRLQLPANPSNTEPSEPCQFDYNTISDVILHIRYTAREGGEPLRTAAITHLNTCIDEAQAAGSLRFFSVRHEFPTEWARFKAIEASPEAQAFPLTIKPGNEHYPFWSMSRLDTVRWVDVFIRSSDNSEVGIAQEAGPDLEGEPNFETIDGDLGLLKTGRLGWQPDSPTDKFTLYLNRNNIDDLYLVFAWGSGT